MAMEIELKLKVEGHDGVRARLVELGAKRLHAYLETNTFLDRADRSMQAAGEGLRLRRNHDLESGRDHYVITHKGPRLAGPVKSREETELTVEDGEAALALLGKLGFVATMVFEKRRESWELDGCEVELDQLPLIGDFVEIEGPSAAAVMAVAEKLGLAHLSEIRPPYVALIEEYLTANNLPRKAIRFEDNV